jgi:fucose permease
MGIEYQGFLKDMLAFFATIAFLGWGTYLLAGFLRRKQQDAMQRHLLEKFSSAQDFAAFVQSPAGQKYVMSLSNAVTNPRNSILSSVQIGIVALFLGPALITAGGRYHFWVISTLGLISVCLGTGFLVSAVASYFLVKKIGLGEKE